MSVSKLRNLIGLVSVCFAYCISIAFPNRLWADDAYHSWLRKQLVDQFHVAGGTWVLANNETDDLTAFHSYGDATTRLVEVDQQPFSRAIRVTSANALQFRWDRAALLDSRAAVKQGDTGLLVFWVRCVSAEAAHGLFAVQVRQAVSPYHASLDKLIAPGPDWQRWFVPFEMQDALSAGDCAVVFQTGAMAQTLEFGGVALINFGNSRTVDDLAALQTRADEDYPGRDARAAWRTAAQERISRHRMADIVVQVVDQDGQPVAGATVNVEMQKHAFGFGSAIDTKFIADQSANGVKYREKILNLDGHGHGFNIVTDDGQLQWLPWETSNAEMLDTLAWVKQNQLDIRGHSLVWPRNQWPVPDDVIEKIEDTNYVDARVRRHISDMLTNPKINHQLVAWDFVNELAHERSFSESFAKLSKYPTGDEVFADWLRLADSLEPRARMFYNEYGLLSEGGANVGFQKAHQNLVRLLQTQSDDKLDGIGLQSHLNLPLAGPERVYDLLDEYARAFPQLEIQITEYDLDIGNEELAADYLGDFMTAVFSHPGTTAFIMWGFWDGGHWLHNAPLFREDWTAKPAYDKYVGLVFDQWWTGKTGQTDARGSYSTRGFLGEYEVAVARGGKTIKTNARVTAGKNALTITIPGADSTPTEHRRSR
jgi:GH35 family endo-1,4-beta-xylanase